MDNLQGTSLKGYELEERIGAGGFGAVYRARQTTIGREVAVKIILPGYANNADFIRRFESEAHLVARLEHPHITPLHDFWRDPDGAYLVMRYLRGGSIRDSLDNGPYELPAASQLLDQVASALDFAHRNNVIHRDIKPGNMLLDEDGNIYLADFGIAKDLTGISNNMTGADAVVGSLDYISPEQARSEPVTPRTDIYSLGVTLYEIITGEHPFPNATTINRLYKHINDPLPEIVSLPDNVRDAINAIIQRATAKNPEDRYPDVLALAVAFREAIGLSPTQSESIVEQLTMREQEILAMIARGMTNREIADELVVTMSTVKWHINQLYKKLGVRNRVQAIVRARELNLIVTGDTADDLPDLKPGVTAVSLPEPENPYKGLHAFQITDSRDFFGRDDLTEKLLDHMKEDDPYHRFLAIVGPSGSGKSSLVRAGLIPALWKGALAGSEKWFVVDMIPGTHPLDKLETALIRVAANQSNNLRDQLQRDERGLLRVADIILPGDDTELVIVVDQFEEVFTLVEDEASRQHFLDLLRVAVSDVRSRIRIVVTLRADYYDRPLHYPEFGDLIRNRMETVLPLSAKGLERAIRGPAERVGVTFDQGLVEQIVSQMNYQAGALPLLQYALTELFDRRQGRLLTSEAYHQIGGAVGALANRADEIYRGLTADGQELAQQMFMRLVTLGEGAEDTRRRATQAELLSLTEDADLMEEIIDQFAAYRLLSLDHDPQTRQPTIEVGHEAILREWDRLRQWLNDSREDIRQERAVSRAAEEWQQHDQDTSFLVRGARLEQVEKWTATTTLIQTPLVQDFIAHSLTQRQKEQQAESERKEHEAHLEQRSRNFLRALVAVFAIATVLAGGLALFALNQRDDALQARDAEAVALEESQRSEAEFRSIALTFGAQDALNNKQPDIALALVQEAIHMDNPPSAAQEIFYHISSSSWIQRRFWVSDAPVFDALYHPDGKRIITTSQDGRMIVWDIETGEILQSTQHEIARLFTATINPEGNLVANEAWGTVQVWDLDTGEVTELYDETVEFLGTPQFTPDGTQLITNGSDNQFHVWSITDFALQRTFGFDEGFFITAFSFSEDGSLLVSSSESNAVKVWDFETGELLADRSFATDITVYDAKLLADEEHILVSNAGAGVIVLWNWRSDEIIWTVNEFTDTQGLALSPDERYFLVGLNEPGSDVQLREVATGDLIRTYEGHLLRVQDVAFSPDGSSFVSASGDGTAIVWTLDWEGTTPTVDVNSNNLVVWHPTEPLIATVGVASGTVNDTVIRLINSETGEIVQELTGHDGSVRYIAFSEDGQSLISGSFGEIDLLRHDLTTGQSTQLLPFDATSNDALLYVSESQFFAPPGESPTSIARWNLETGEMLQTFEGHLGIIWALDINPATQTLYSGSRDSSLYAWDIESGDIVAEFAGHSAAILDIDLSPDGTRLVSASDDQTAIVWDAITGEQLMTLNAHTAFVTNTEFSPDGQFILTAGADGRVILWDATTGELRNIYVGGQNAVRTVATFSPDGTQIVSSTNDHMTFWDITDLPDDYETWVAENRYTPDFTCEQRELYQIEPTCETEQ